ncbi:aminotransferase class I/II-fold pyridoxal phosphate-dependent enzyme [Jiangella aurantiaca]|uniref:Aminotransferase class I/II-fold pyridoxal phosphate-dependent enzyme n=1 Tax=Jiangella aurantiaca TaxID=2530373 RepID=A0A4R5AH80_9ACTN|nr:aminotransferase class I/II-fold pyridoxal phosphate-dependent enzyme [Jiangella aurantiaca]TDD72038.1 aminotransferase class I/II-fold pyridoxal phosphate-dependent enzyme [Jiangella aurantiaca]
MAAEQVIAGRTSRAIADSVEAAIEAGRLAESEPLPSVRGLAARLGVSPTTVSAAYRDLRLRGVVTSEAGRVTRVGVRPVSRAQQYGPVGPGVRDLSDGNPDPELLPDIRAALRRLELPPFLYGAPAVLPELAEIATEQFGDLPGWLRTNSGPVAVVGGAMDGVERVLASRARPNDRVAVEDPGYPGVLELVRSMGMVPVGVAVDDGGPVPSSLAAALATGPVAFVVTPRAQNPTGAAVDAARARELRAVLDDYPDVLVVEDDHASLIAGARYVSVCIGRRSWAIVRTTSKVLGPDLRTGFLLADPRTARRVAERQLVGAGWVSHLLQRLVVQLWSDDDVRTGMRLAGDVYRARREALLSRLAERRIAARGRSGLNVCVPVPHEVAVVQALQSRGWAVRAGEPHRTHGEPFVRITTATLTADEADRLAADLAAVLGRSRRTRLA